MNGERSLAFNIIFLTNYSSQAITRVSKSHFFICYINFFYIVILIVFFGSFNY